MLRIVIAVLILSFALPAQATEAGWALLRNGGHVVLLRHAMTTGTVEPPNFDIEKCATQLNLSERGRQQARKIGALFAARAAPVEKVLASRYCRTLETARLAFDDQKVEPMPALDKPTEATAEADVAAVMDIIRELLGLGQYRARHPSREHPGADRNVGARRRGLDRRPARRQAACARSYRLLAACQSCIPQGTGPGVAAKAQDFGLFLSGKTD